MAYRANRGLGANMDAQTIWCSDAWKWPLNPACWGYSPSAWAQMAQFRAQAPKADSIKPPPAVDAGTSTVPAPYQCAAGEMATAATNCPEYTAAVDAALAQGKQLTDQALLDWFKEQPIVPDAKPMCFVGTPVMAPDGSWSCDSSAGSSNWLLWGGLAVGAVFAISMLGGGGPRRYGR